MSMKLSQFIQKLQEIEKINPDLEIATERENQYQIDEFHGDIQLIVADGSYIHKIVLSPSEATHLVL